jgi:predicted TIM-barrel fold metal-dependent hydrolase
MNIIDTHVHLGTSKFSRVRTTEEEILIAMKKYGITTSLVMPQPTLEDISTVHRSIAEMSRKHPGQIYGMVSLDPWLEEDEYVGQLKICVEAFQFVAIKLHPMGHNISPLSPRCDKLYEAARLYNLPVLVHTGIGTPFSLPSLLIEPAGRYPDVTFILAHAGFAIYTDEAIVAAKTRDNIILEPSWCPTYSVRKMVDQLGAERLIMGSDHISNLPVELAKFGAIQLNDSQLEQIYVNNPKRIFRLPS